MLENRQSNDEERLSQLEKELEETILCGEEADRNYEEVTSLARLFHTLPNVPDIGPLFVCLLHVNKLLHGSLVRGFSSMCFATLADEVAVVFVARF